MSRRKNGGQNLAFAGGQKDRERLKLEGGKRESMLAGAGDKEKKIGGLQHNEHKNTTKVVCNTVMSPFFTRA